MTDQEKNGSNGKPEGWPYQSNPTYKRGEKQTNAGLPDNSALQDSGEGLPASQQDNELDMSQEDMEPAIIPKHPPEFVEEEYQDDEHK